MQFDDSLISKLEGLAKLKFATEERAKISQDLEKIMGMIQRLESVDTTGIAPLIYLNETTNTMRTDEVAGQIPKEQAFRNAPQHNDDFITIPKVINI